MLWDNQRADMIVLPTQPYTKRICRVERLVIHEGMMGCPRGQGRLSELDPPPTMRSQSPPETVELTGHIIPTSSSVPGHKVLAS